MTGTLDGVVVGQGGGGPRRWLAEIVVTPKAGVNDPEGETIRGGLRSLGFDVDAVRAGRFIRLVVEAADRVEAERSVTSMCEQLLANPVIQTYAITVVEDEKAGKGHLGGSR